MPLEKLPVAGKLKAHIRFQPESRLPVDDGQYPVELSIPVWLSSKLKLIIV